MIELAKPVIDVGLYTNQPGAMLCFWDRLPGVQFREVLSLAGDIEQHRHEFGDSILKVNHAGKVLPEPESGGLHRLVLASHEVSRVSEDERDPDGNRVALVPLGYDGIESLRMEILVADIVAARSFYGTALGLEAVDRDTFRCGASQIRLREGSAGTDPAQLARGYRYITMQVFDVVAAHAEILAAGGREGMAPMKIGEVARVSFVRDPGGNWIEISQRKSLTNSID